MENSKPQVDLFTDGSCPANPGPGGWAYIIRIRSSGSEISKSGGEAATTNNRQELRAVIEGLKVLQVRPCSITLYSDSQYVTNGISLYMAKWKKQKWLRYDHTLKTYEAVKNVDLWQQLDFLMTVHEFRVNWVRGHDGHPENERCDEMAGAATKKVVSEMI